MAERLGVSAGVVYYWIARGHLATHRGSRNRLRIPFPPEVEQTCRERIASSARCYAPRRLTTNA